MTLEFFYTNYDISDIEIKKLYVKNNQLFLVGKYNIYLELKSFYLNYISFIV